MHFCEVQVEKIQISPVPRTELSYKSHTSGAQVEESIK